MSSDIRHLYHDILFVYLFFIPNNDCHYDMTYYCSILFVALLIHFSYEDKRLTSIEQCTIILTHPLTSGIH